MNSEIPGIVFWTCFSIPTGFGLGVFVAMMFGIDVIECWKQMFGRRPRD